MNQAILQIVCGVLGTFAFALFFHVAPRHLVLATVGGGLSWLLYLLVFAQGNGVFLSALAASFGICLWSEIMARVRKAPTNIFLIPGIIPLLPGGSLYYTMNALINGDMATVIQRGRRPASWRWASWWAYSLPRRLSASSSGRRSDAGGSCAGRVPRPPPQRAEETDLPKNSFLAL